VPFEKPLYNWGLGIFGDPWSEWWSPDCHISQWYLSQEFYAHCLFHRVFENAPSSVIFLHVYHLLCVHLTWTHVTLDNRWYRSARADRPRSILGPWAVGVLVTLGSLIVVLGFCNMVCSPMSLYIPSNRFLYWYGTLGQGFGNPSFAPPHNGVFHRKWDRSLSWALGSPTPSLLDLSIKTWTVG